MSIRSSSPTQALYLISVNFFCDFCQIEILMARNGYSMWGSAKAPQLGLATFQPSSSKLSVKLIKHDLEKWCKWECCNLHGLVRRAVSPNEDEKPVLNVFESFRDAVRVRDEMTALEEYLYSVDVNHRPRPSEFYLHLSHFTFL